MHENHWVIFLIIVVLCGCDLLEGLLLCWLAWLMFG